MEGAPAACVGVSHPVWPLVLPLRTHPCLCRCPVSCVGLDPACSCFFGNHEMEILQTYPASFVCCSFCIGLFMNTNRVYDIQYYIKKIPFLNCFCSWQLFFLLELKFSHSDGNILSATKSVFLQEEISATSGVIDLIIEILVNECTP